MKKFFPLAFLLWFCFASFSVSGQQNEDTRVTENFQNTPLKEALVQLEKNYPVRLFYQDIWISRDIMVTLNLRNEPFTSALTKILKQTDLNFIPYSPTIVVLVRDPNKNIASGLLFTDTIATQKATDQKVIVTARNKATSRERTVRISGNITDKSTGERVIGATVFVEELKTGATTNDNGFYSVSVPPGAYTLTYNIVGYQRERRRVNLRANQVINLELAQRSVQMKEVTIMGESPDRNINKLEMSTTKLDIKTIKKIPAFLGEVDVVKSVQLLPGVTTVGEGASGFNVRGGSADQNLILLDDAPVYNSSHMFGLFSVFNPDVVKDVTLYRGGIPAQYGGRASSVLDIKLKDASAKKITGRGGIGVVSNRLSLEGPLLKDKSYFMLAGRASLADLVLKALPNKTLKNTSVSFYDFNAKVDHKFSENDRLSLSAYVGNDRFKLASDSVASVDANASSTVFRWNNANVTGRWTHYYSDKFSASFTGVYTNYVSDVINPDGPNTFRLRSGIGNKILKADFAYLYNDKHQITFGINTNYYSVTPGSFTANGKVSSISPKILQSEHGIETSIYANDEYKFTTRFSILYGLRYSVFNALGPGRVYSYQGGATKEPETIIDSTFYRAGSIQHTYGGFEPRLALKYSITENNSLKLSYNRMRQYIHLITNTAAITPTDRWKISDKHVKPQISDQVALGYFHNFRENTIEASVEVYYKGLQNVPDYKNGATLLLNSTLEADILAGRGKSYGVEWMLRKTVGDVTGWASYTFSRTFMQVEPNFPGELSLVPNRGDWYPANFDKPHVLNLVSTYQINRRLSYSANFLYSTGRPATYPAAKYVVQGIVVPHYPYRNQDRIPSYHRLDFSATYDGNHKRNKKWDGSWTFSIYNIYSRNNAFSIFFRDRQAYKLSILGSAFPSITYNFKF